MFLQLRYRRKQRRILNSQTSKMEYFAKIVNCHKPLTIFTKCSILDIWEGFEYAYDKRWFDAGLRGCIYSSPQINIVYSFYILQK